MNAVTLIETTDNTKTANMSVEADTYSAAHTSGNVPVLLASVRAYIAHEKQTEKLMAWFDDFEARAISNYAAKLSAPKCANGVCSTEWRPTAKQAS